MRIAHLAAAALVAVTPLFAQNATPAQPVHGPTPARPAVAALNRADPNSPAQAGRNALYKYLDDIATKDGAARSEKIAKITTRAKPRPASGKCAQR